MKKIYNKIRNKIAKMFVSKEEENHAQREMDRCLARFQEVIEAARKANMKKY